MAFWLFCFCHAVADDVNKKEAAEFLVSQIYDQENAMRQQMLYVTNIETKHSAIEVVASDPRHCRGHRPEALAVVIGPWIMTAHRHGIHKRLAKTTGPQGHLATGPYGHRATRATRPTRA